MVKKSILFPAKNNSIARKISIKTPGQFNKSIDKLKKNGLTRKENMALKSARKISKVQLKRKNLSVREQNQMMAISKTVIPRATR